MIKKIIYQDYGKILKQFNDSIKDEKYENEDDKPKPPQQRVGVDFEDIDNGIRIKFTFYDYQEKKSDGEYDVELDENGNLIRYININYDAFAGKIVDIRTSNMFGTYTLLFKDRFTIARGEEFLDVVIRSDLFFPVLTFSVNEDKTEFVAFIRNFCNKPSYQDAEFIEKDSKIKSFAQIMCDNSEFCKNKINKHRKKCEEAIFWLDPYASIAYLEAQVDALTRLVLKLTDKDTDEVNILKEADKYSVLDIKTTDNMIKEFKEDKGNARKRQTAFYTTTA